MKNLHFETLELYIPRLPRNPRHVSPGLEGFVVLHHSLRNVCQCREQCGSVICSAYSTLLIQSMPKALTILAPLEGGGSTTRPKELLN